MWAVGGVPTRKRTEIGVQGAWWTEGLTASRPGAVHWRLPGPRGKFQLQMQGSPGCQADSGGLAHRAPLSAALGVTGRGRRRGLRGQRTHHTHHGKRWKPGTRVGRQVPGVRAWAVLQAQADASESRVYP